VPDEGARRSRRPSSLATDAVANPPPPKRATSTNLRKRTETGSVMPAAPPRKSKQIAVTAAVTAPRPRLADPDDGLSQIVDVRGLRANAQSRLRAVVLVALGLALAVLAFVFRDELMRMPVSSLVPGTGSGVSLRLSVTTNPPTTVIIVPPKGAPGRQPIDLGRTPIIDQAGAFVGDTVMLLNDDRGIRWLEPLDLGEPNALKTIEKTFKETTIKVTTRPKVKAGMIFRNSQKIGQVGVPMAIFPGVQQLEVRSESLTDPVPFEVTIGDGQVTTKEVDVSAAIEKPDKGSSGQ
jgi:hypothetical protein